MTANLAMFDYDGVIGDSYEMHVACMLQAFARCSFHAITTPEAVIALYAGNVYDSLAEYGLSVTQIDEIIAEYKNLQGERIDSVHLFPGIKEALERIAQSSRIYIITSNISEAVTGILKQKDIRCVADVLGSDKEKSKTKKIRNLVAQYPGSQAYYIGDTQGDIIEGRAAGVKTIGVAWGWHSPDQLKLVAPDYMADTPAQLEKLLEGTQTTDPN